MKKQILALIACLMLVMSTTAQAVTLRAGSFAKPFF